MKKKWISLLVFLLALSLLCGCGKKYTCAECGKESSKAYYEMHCDPEYLMCEDCARIYWMPLNYENYRVK